LAPEAQIVVARIAGRVVIKALESAEGNRMDKADLQAELQRELGRRSLKHALGAANLEWAPRGLAAEATSRYMVPPSSTWAPSAKFEKRHPEPTAMWRTIKESSWVGLNHDGVLMEWRDLDDADMCARKARLVEKNVSILRKDGADIETVDVIARVSRRSLNPPSA
jgi:hypothetical protein